MTAMWRARRKPSQTISVLQNLDSADFSNTKHHAISTKFMLILKSTSKIERVKLFYTVPVHITQNALYKLYTVYTRFLKMHALSNSHVTFTSCTAERVI